MIIRPHTFSTKLTKQIYLATSIAFMLISFPSISNAQSVSLKKKIVDSAVGEWQTFANGTSIPAGIILNSKEEADQVDTLHTELQKCSQINKYWNALPLKERRSSVDNVAMPTKAYYRIINTAVPSILPPGTSTEGKASFDTCQWPTKILSTPIPGTINKYSLWDLYPWSAAFISYLFTKDDPKRQFPAAAGHWQYINKSIRSNGNTGAPFTAVDAAISAPRIGDLICASRNTQPLTYSSIRGKALKGIGYEAHCDLVVAINKTTLEAIGGNVSDSVAKTIVPISNNGVIKISQPIGWDGNWTKWRAWRNWAVIIRNNLP